MPSGDFRPPSTDWQQGYDAGYREAQEDAEQAAVPLDVERLERAIADISEEWAESAEWLARMIVTNDAEYAADTPSSDTPERPA